MSRLTRLFSLLLIPALLAVSSTGLLAVGPQFWTVASQAEFLSGTSNGVSIDAAGRLLAAPAVATVHDLAAPQAWSLLTADDGTWYAGTGGDGRVVSGRMTDPSAAVRTVLDVESASVHALARIGSRVFAAGSPDGAVHVIEADGSSRVFFDPAEPYIWALAPDAAGRLWVATGHPATIHRVNPDGTSIVVYRPPARHAVGLVVDGQGRMFAGTDQPARLYRFDANDRPFVVLESELTELRALTPTPDGGLFVAAVTASGEPGGDTAVTGTVTITVGGVAAGSSSTTSGDENTSGRRSTLYRIDPNGQWEAVWNTTDAIYDLAATDDRTVLVATGPDARVYQVSTDRTVLLLTTVDARQVTRLSRQGDATYMATANPGRLLRLGGTGGTAAAATYTSPVRDGKTTSRWGTIQWDGTGAVRLQSRTGNTELPDDSWSPWSEVYTQPSGQAVTSPDARFLQWRATFPAAETGALLTSVTVAYLPRNTRPAVTEITVHPAGVVFQRPFSSDEGAIAGLDDAVADARRPPGSDATTSSSLGRRMFQRELRTFQWKADDADGDRVMFTLHYRREGETAWRPLRDRLSDPLFVWDTSSVPDGRYFVRVTATDNLSNTPDRVLSGDRESTVVDIDNTPPAITITVTGLRADVRVVDGHSAIQRVDFAIDGAGWQPLRPVDGLSDSREERYEITLPSSTAATGLVVRATDTMQNVTSAVTGRRP
jgi:sugar lactone lactonase YvrE